MIDNYSEYYLYKVQLSPQLKWTYTFVGASNGNCPFNQEVKWTVKIGAGTFQENGMHFGAFGDVQPKFKRVPHNLYQYELLTDGAATYTMGDQN